MTEIKNSSIIESGNHIDYDRLYTRYTKAVQNTKRFNLQLTRAKKVKVANGEKTEFYRKDNNELLQEWYILSDRYGLEFGYITYKEIK